MRRLRKKLFPIRKVFPLHGSGSPGVVWIDALTPGNLHTSLASATGTAIATSGARPADNVKGSAVLAVITAPILGTGKALRLILSGVSSHYITYGISQDGRIMQRDSWRETHSWILDYCVRTLP